MEHEVFRQIDGTNYKVSNKGTVVNAKTGHLKKPTTNKTTYRMRIKKEEEDETITL